MASAREVASRFGISLPTAHEIINQLVKEGLLYRVRGSGTFIRRDKTRDSLRIALLDMPVRAVPQSLYHVFEEEINHIYNLLRSRNFQVQIISYFELRNRVQALELLRSFDGLLISFTYLDQYSFPLFQESKTPFVVFLHSYEIDQPCSQVYADFLPGMMEALKLVVPSRRENPVIFTETNVSCQASCDLWKKSLQNFGIPSEKIETVVIDYLRRSFECYKYVRVYHEKLAKKLILTSSDGLACDLIAAFMLENYQPGKDFHVISCGDREAQGFRFSDEPMITSIGVPEKQIINEAVKLLLRLIESPSDCIYLTKIPSRLTIRKSFTGQD